MKVPKYIKKAIIKTGEANAIAFKNSEIVRNWLEKNNLTEDTAKSPVMNMEDNFIDCCEYGNNNTSEFIEILENLKGGLTMKLEEAIKFLKLHSNYNGKLDKGQCIRIPEENFTKTKQAIETVLQALENSIPKQVIKEKLIESETLIDNSQGCINNEDLYKEYGKIKLAKELLEGK